MHGATSPAPRAFFSHARFSPAHCISVGKPADTSTPCADLAELSRLVEQDGISSDILPAYLQALLTVRLIEPDYSCRRAALRLSVYNPPLSPTVLAMALRAMAQDRPETSGPPPHPRGKLKRFLSCIRRIWHAKAS